MNQATKAIVFATTAHAGQFRKVTNMPYVVHPIRVGGILRTFYPHNEGLEIAGYLHDIVVDTPFTIVDIEAEFGGYVARLVQGVTRTPSWKLEEWHIEPNVYRLKAADMIDNITDFDGDFSMFAKKEKKWEQWERQVNIVNEAIGSEDIMGYLRTVLKEAKP
jgi:(p)ppGpp synthase/HD superfamily hydrolase